MLRSFALALTVAAGLARAGDFVGPLAGVYCGSQTGGTPNQATNQALFFTVWQPGTFEIAHFAGKCNIVGGYAVATGAMPGAYSLSFNNVESNCKETQLVGAVFSPSAHTLVLTITVAGANQTYHLSGGADSDGSACAAGVLPTGDYCGAGPAMATGDATMMVFSIDQNFGYTMNLVGNASGSTGCRASGSAWNYNGDLALTIFSACPGNYTFNSASVQPWGLMTVTLNLNDNDAFVLTRGACREREGLKPGTILCGGTGLPPVPTIPGKVANVGMVFHVGQLAFLTGSAAMSYQLSILGGLATHGFYTARGAFWGNGFTNNQNGMSPYTIDSWRVIEDPTHRSSNVLLGVKGKAGNASIDATLGQVWCQANIVGIFTGRAATPAGSVAMTLSFNTHGFNTFQASVKLIDVPAPFLDPTGAGNVTFPQCQLQGHYYDGLEGGGDALFFNMYATTCYAGFVFDQGVYHAATAQQPTATLTLYVAMQGPASTGFYPVTLHVSP